MYTQTSTLTNVTAGGIYPGQAVVSVPAGKYIVIREVYRRGDFDASAVMLRVGRNMNDGGYVISTTMNNGILQHIEYLSVNKTTSINSYVVVDTVSTTGQSVIVRTSAIKIA